MSSWQWLCTRRICSGSTATLPAPYGHQLVGLLPIAVLLYLAINLLTGVHKRVWRFLGLRDVAAIARAVAIAFVISCGWRVLDAGVFAGTPVPFGVLVIHPFLVFVALVGGRLARRVLYDRAGARETDLGTAAVCRRLLLAGAGEAGLHLLRELRDTDFEVVGFVDDDPALQGRTIGGWQVLGTTDDLEAVVRAHRVDEVILCIPSAPKTVLRRSWPAARTSRSKPQRCRPWARSCPATWRLASSGP